MKVPLALPSVELTALRLCLQLPFIHSVAALDDYRRRCERRERRSHHVSPEVFLNANSSVRLLLAMHLCLGGFFQKHLQHAVAVLPELHGCRDGCLGRASRDGSLSLPLSLVRARRSSLAPHSPLSRPLSPSLSHLVSSRSWRSTGP